jgi:hypothetical protein
MLEAVVAHVYPERPVAIGGLQVGLPQTRRFEDVPVAVDHERLGRHRVLLGVSGSSGSRYPGLRGEALRVR